MPLLPPLVETLHGLAAAYTKKADVNDLGNYHDLIDVNSFPAAPPVPPVHVPPLFVNPPATPGLPPRSADLNRPTRQPSVLPHVLGSIGSYVAADALAGQAIRRIPQSASLLGPAATSLTGLQMQAAQHLRPTYGRLGGHTLAFIGADTVRNAGVDALEGMGLWNSTPGRLTGWQVPERSSTGEILRNPDGSPRWQLGFNPSGFGWNMREHDRNTTPRDNTISSYLGSSLSAYSRPLVSATSLAHAAGWEANPLTQAAFNPEEREGWLRLVSGRTPQPGGRTSVPLTASNYLSLRPWRPNFSSSSPLFAREQAIHREHNTYHPVYNPSGGRRAPSWFTRWWNNRWN